MLYYRPGPLLALVRLVPPKTTILNLRRRLAPAQLRHVPVEIHPLQRLGRRQPRCPATALHRRCTLLPDLLRRISAAFAVGGVWY